MNAEHGEEKCTGESACLCTQMSGSNLSEGIWCVQSIFNNTKKLKNSNKKSKKLPKLFNDVQKKTKQNRKKQKVCFMPKSIECVHRKYEKVDTHKK